MKRLLMESLLVEMDPKFPARPEVSEELSPKEKLIEERWKNHKGPKTRGEDMMKLLRKNKVPKL